MEQLIKRRLFCFVCLLFCVAMLLISSSYAFEGTKNVNHISNNLQVVYETENQILESSAYPMTFQQGIASSPSNKVKIVNKSDFSTKVFLLVSKTDVKNEDLALNKLYYFIDQVGDISRIEDAQEEIIYQKLLAPHEIIELDIKMWIGADLVEYTDQGKKIKLQFKITEE